MIYNGVRAWEEVRGEVKRKSREELRICYVT